MKMAAHYLFDFDGVLVDSMPVWAGTYVHMLEERGIPVPEGFVRKITPLGNAGAAKCLIEAGLQMTEKEILDAAMTCFDREYAHSVPLKAHVAETLKRLRASGSCVHVLTGSSHRYVDPCLKRHGIYDLFGHIWSVDDFPYTKADPEIYREAARRLSVPLSDCLFFDDNAVAVTTAKNAGMPAVAVYDASSADFERMKTVADRCITDFSEI